MTTLFSDLALDPVTGDLDLTGDGLNIIDSNQVSLRQRLVVRFTVWQGDWFFDELLGFPYRVYISKKVMRAVLDSKIKETINLEPDVLQIQNFRSTLDSVNRRYAAYFDVLTREGDTISLAFSGSDDEYQYPTPSEQSASLCGDEAWITWQNKLYYQINFRLPYYGDGTWYNKWKPDPNPGVQAGLIMTEDRKNVSTEDSHLIER